MKIKAFGCSFVWGTDLPDATAKSGSRLTWPALMAQRRGLDYKNCAIGGIGNTHIAAYVTAELGEADNADSIYVIQWTWADRFDYIDHGQHWQTLRPSQDMPHADYYYRHLHSEFRDRFTSLQAMLATITVLQQRQQPFVMTALDNSLGDTVDAHWFHPSILASHWHLVRQHLHWFQGRDFLSWSRDHGYAESALYHPLVDAHAAAAELVLPAIDAILHRA